MDERTVVIVLFAAAVVSALCAAFAKTREKVLPKVEKLALAVALAASAFLVEVTNFFSK
jgi:hypothetical protein